MPNLVKFFVSNPNTTGDTESIIKDSVDLSVASMDFGPTSRTGYFNGTNPPASGYTIYSVSGTSSFSATTRNYLNVNAGVQGVYAMQADETNLYGCIYSNTVFKVPTATFNSFSTKTTGAGETPLNALALDDNYIYVGTATNTGRVIRINKSDFSTSTTLALSANTGSIYSMLIDGQFLYCILLNTPSRVVKINRSTFTVVDTKIFQAGFNDAYCATQDTNHLYIGLLTNPGILVKLSKSDFSTTSGLTFNGTSSPTSAAGILSVSLDDEFVYCGTENNAGSKLIKVRKSSFTEVTPSISWPSEGDGWYSLFTNDPYIYGGYNSTTVPKVVVFNRLSFASAATISLTGTTGILSTAIDTYYQYFGTNTPSIVRMPTFNRPEYYTANNDSQALTIIQNLAGTGVTLSTISQALTYVASGMSNTVVLNKAYPNIVTSGMVLNIDSRLTPSYPGSSTRWYDLSGNNFISNMTNGTIPFTSQYPQFFDYTSTASYFLGNNSLANNVKSAITITSWFIQTVGGGRCILFDKVRNAVLQGYVFEAGTVASNWTATTRFFAQGTNQLNALDFRGQNNVIQINIPYMCTVTFDWPSRVTKLYINQNEITGTNAGGGTLANLSQDWSQSPNDWQTGSSRPDYNADSSMKQFGVMVHNRALSATEVAQNFYQGPIVTSGLTVAADASNIVSYVGSGTSWYNLAVTGSTGTTSGSPVFKPDNGGILHFDGVDDRADFGGTYSGTSTASLTYCCWIRVPSTAARAFVVRGRDGAGAGSSVYVGTNSSNNAIMVVTTTNPSTSTVTATSSSTLASNTWYHLTGVWTAGQHVKIYVNGVLRGTTNTSTTVLRESTSGINIASLSASLFYQFDMSSFWIYNRVLTDNEIVQNYTAHYSRFI